MIPVLSSDVLEQASKLSSGGGGALCDDAIALLRLLGVSVNALKWVSSVR